MNIVIVDRGNPIPAKKYGGTERVIWALGHELNKQGHKVTFIVPDGSKCSFANIVVYDASKPLEQLIPTDTDLVHLFFMPEETITIPHLITMGANPSAGVEMPLNTVFVSKNHANRYNSDAFVHNCLLWSDYHKIDLGKKRTHLHFLAKGSWKVKNLSGSARIAVKSGNRLHVLGADRWKSYNFKRSPLYTLHPKVKYFGMADDLKKVEVMQESKGLLFPVKWHEPFGLAIIESMYCGCPVFGSDMGSLTELVTQETGFVSNDEEELIDAVKTMKFDTEVCHKYAVDNFNPEVITNKYLSLYDKVMAGETLNKTSPSLIIT